MYNFVINMVIGQLVTVHILKTIFLTVLLNVTSRGVSRGFLLVFGECANYFSYSIMQKLRETMNIRALHCIVKNLDEHFAIHIVVQQNSDLFRIEVQEELSQFTQLF